jgi:hypothetical protein
LVKTAISSGPCWPLTKIDATTIWSPNTMWHMALKLDFKSLLLNAARPLLSVCARLVGLLAGERAKSFRNSSNADLYITGVSWLSTANPCNCNCLVLAAMTQFKACLLSATEARLYAPVVSSRITACARKVNRSSEWLSLSSLLSELLADGASRRRRAR